jgi:hypothetical protein
VVAVAPVGDPADLIGPLAENRSPFVVLFAAGFLAVRPDVDVTDLLTDVGLEAVTAARTSCQVPSPDGHVLRRYSRTFGSYLAQNRAGGAAATAPVLVQQGTADALITRPRLLRTVGRLCASGDVVELRAVDADHVDVLAAGDADRAAWLRSRFAGDPVASECPPGSAELSGPSSRAIAQSR